MSLTTIRRPDGWYIDGVTPYSADGETHTAYGPYQTRADAESDRRGIERFNRQDRREIDELAKQWEDVLR